VTIRLLFWILKFHKVVQQNIADETELLVCVRRQFSYKSPPERILKIGLNYQSYCQTSRGTLFWDTVYIY